jgi:hypothetical protein
MTLVKSSYFAWVPLGINLRQSGSSSSLIVVRFALCERKTNNRKIRSTMLPSILSMPALSMPALSMPALSLSKGRL